MSDPMNRQPYGVNQWARPLYGDYELGPQRNAFLDQPVPHADEVRDYAKQAMHQQSQRNRDVMNKSIPDAIRDQQMIGFEDQVMNKAITPIQEAQGREPVYRVFRFLADSKYCTEPSIATRILIWTIAPIMSMQATGTIQAPEDYINGISVVRATTFEVPSTIFSASDLYFGEVWLRIESLNAPAITTTAYYGPISRMETARYTFRFTIAASSQFHRIKLIPIEPVLNFAFPVNLSQSKWSLSFASPTSQSVILPPVILNGSTSASNPLLISMAPVPHGLTTGESITIETIGITTTPPYVPSSTIYAITVTSSTDFTIPLDGSTIVGTVAIQVTVVTREIKAEFELRSLDKVGSKDASTRGLLTIA